MVEIKVVKERCPANHRCPAIRVCEVGALVQNGFDAPTIDESKCTKCGKCTKVCPMGALIRVPASTKNEYSNDVQDSAD